ncbi:MAG TPA: M56 family metallopeptidase [Acidobacteriaceae bacterium]
MALVRIAGSAQVRFRLWLGMLVTFTAQWLWTLAGIVRTFHTLHGPGTVDRAALASVPAQRAIAVSSSAASVLTYAMAVLFVLYCVAVTRQLAQVILEKTRLARVLRHSCEPRAALANAFAHAVGGRDIRCVLDVLPGLASPATVGWLRPRVLMPLVCEMQEEVELEPVFWHELKHVERRDALWNGIARACRALVCFHPATYFAMRRLVGERELACDAAVVAEHPESCDVYASCLVRFARAVDLAASPAISAVEMASRSTQLSVRVREILAERSETGLLARYARFGMSTMIAVAMLAALPGLTILLYSEIVPSAPALRSFSQLRLNSLPSQRHIYPAKSTEPKPQQPQITVAAPTHHDEALAAEHRVAMGVLTESTGIEGQPTAVTGDNPIDMRDADRSGHASGTWTSVAVDAAERMGPMLAAHDSDGRR